MARIGVFLPDEQLRTCDQVAKEVGLRRSELIQRALVEYVEEIRRKREEAASRAKMVESCRRMDEMAQTLGHWNGVAVIRRFRQTWRGRSSH